ncbi:MAG: hypothetical protein DMF53_13890 [Acidobacteria bacterium]|nr:MAG: hypothetical protein DMF53_13890 [Acidobacteriota bacterium]
MTTLPAKGDDDMSFWELPLYQMIKAERAVMVMTGYFHPMQDEIDMGLVQIGNSNHGSFRPLTVPFWESPDIFVAPDMNASTAPDTPTTLGGLAKAGVPNTLWAHVWNLGRAPVYNARVEFYWRAGPISFRRGIQSTIANQGRV